MIINKKIKRTMMENKSQYIGSLVLIIISCMLYTMFNQLAINMKTMTSSFEKNYVQDNASFTLDKKLMNINNLENKFNMKIEQSESFDYEISKKNTLRIFSENTKVDIPAVLSGKKLNRNSILIDPSYAEANKLKIGDSVKIKDKKLTIAGFMSMPNYIFPLKSNSDLMTNPNNFGIAVITKSDFNSFGIKNNAYSIKFNDNSNLKNKIKSLKNYFKDNNIIVLNWINIDENPRVTYVTAKIDSISSVSASFPIAILLLTCTLTGIVMSRMLKKEAIIIGTMYALGYRKKEIKKHYLTYALSIAIVGGIIGTLIGALTLKPMITFMVSYFNMPIESLSFDFKYIIISLLLPIVFLYTSSYIIINKELKHSPVDLMKGGKETNKVNFIEKHLRLEKLKFNSKFRLREQLRNIPRSLLLLFGVIAATMLLLLGFASKSSVDFLIKDTIVNTYKYKYEYLFNSLQKYNPSKGEKFSESAFTLKSDNKIVITTYGINPNTQNITLKDKSGKNLNKNKVVMTRALANRLNLKTNDTIKLVNKFDSKEYNIKIDSIAETYVGQNIYMPLSEFNKMLNYPKESYLGLWSSSKINIPSDKLISFLSIDDFKKSMDAMTQPLQYSIGSIAFMAFIIGLIIIYVVTSLIIDENKGNISLMKVLGYRKKEVYSLILNSSSFIVILGYILGVPLLLISLKALFNSITKAMNLSFEVRLNYLYIFIGFIIIYLTYELSKLLSRKKINKISMVEALKGERE